MSFTLLPTHTLSPQALMDCLFALKRKTYDFASLTHRESVGEVGSMTKKNHTKTPFPSQQQNSKTRCQSQRTKTKKQNKTKKSAIHWQKEIWEQKKIVQHALFFPSSLNLKNSVVFHSNGAAVLLRDSANKPLFTNTSTTSFANCFLDVGVQFAMIGYSLSNKH